MLDTMPAAAPAAVPAVPGASLLPDLAKAIADAFPELEGRALAVSEAEITAENVPSLLPIAMLAVVSDDTVWPEKTNARVEIAETFMIKFMLKPVKIRRPDGAETPFWAFYDPVPLRNRLYALLWTYRSPAPARGRVRPSRMDFGADPLSTEISFTCTHKSFWCEPPAEPLLAPGCLTVQACFVPAPAPECCVCEPTAEETAAADCLRTPT